MHSRNLYPEARSAMLRAFCVMTLHLLAQPLCAC